METKPCFGLVFFLILCCLVAENHGFRQGDAIRKLLEAEALGKSNMDKTHFQPSDLSQSEEIKSLNKSISNISKESDKIVKLPGQPTVNFSQYGGYVTVDEINGRAFYYYFVEAENNSDELPLLLWFNGGPGCSSMGYGAMQEIGPFRVHYDGINLHPNKFSWNKVANLLFVEFPIGVGFSYSNTTRDYRTYGDRKTAEDNYVFILKWIERFPEYKGREFYIAGESYAGHYVSQLAYNILNNNNKLNITSINLKGIIMGNAMVNHETDVLRMFEYFGSHALSSPETVDQIKQLCRFENNKIRNDSLPCFDAIYKTYVDTNDIDMYNIYAPLCTDRTFTSVFQKFSENYYDACSAYYVSEYLNGEEVQQAMHANVTKLNYSWKLCDDNVVDLWRDKPPTVLPLLQDFMAHGLRVWLYSGDIDARIPVTATQYSIKAMNLTIKTEWHPWYLNGEVGGYAQEYKGDLTFATVRGAGHEVPLYQPDRALTMISSFLAGKPLPRKPN